MAIRFSLQDLDRTMQHMLHCGKLLGRILPAHIVGTAFSCRNPNPSGLAHIQTVGGRRMLGFSIIYDKASEAIFLTEFQIFEL